MVPAIPIVTAMLQQMCIRINPWLTSRINPVQDVLVASVASHAPVQGTSEGDVTRTRCPAWEPSVSQTWLRVVCTLADSHRLRRQKQQLLCSVAGFLK